MVAAAAIVASPAIAAGYADHTLFEAPAIEGGGGSRYFTGSRVDGYSCNVCHTEGTTDDFSIEGLPRTAVAGQRYELTIRWRDPDVPHGLLLELSTASGVHPMVSIPGDAMQTAQMRCGALAGSPSALYLIDNGVRRIVGVEPCGASLLEVSFIATGEPIELALGGVRGNNNDAPTGDSTFERRVVLGDSAPAEPGGCATGGRAGWLTALAAALLAVTVRRQTAR